MEEKERYIPGYVYRREHLYKLANMLAVITIFYNVIEGLISISFGYVDGTVALLGFGVDSYVEVISGVGIWHMIQRASEGNFVEMDFFERKALKITGTAFYILSAGLALTALIGFIKGHKPDSSFWGIVISIISILAMWALVHYKIDVGKKLNSDAILADAQCSKACLYLSITLLISSLGYELTGIGGFDSAGALVLGIFSFKEGREAFQKAEGKKCICGEKSNKQTL